MDVYDKLEILKEVLGVEELLDELARALSNSQLNEELDYIANNWEIDFE